MQDLDALAQAVGVRGPLVQLPGSWLNTVAASGSPGHGVVVRRLYPDGAGLDRARFDLCLELYAAGISLPRPLSFHLVGGAPVSVWERLDPSGPVDWEAVGAVFAALHACPVRPSVPLVWHGDPSQVLVDAELLASSGAMHPGTVAGLVAVWREGWELVDGPGVVVHADAWGKNFLFTPSGPALIDWDMVCVAPALVDLCRIVCVDEHHNRDALGGWGPPDIAAFASGYGATLPETAVARRVVRAHTVALVLRLSVQGVLPDWVRATAVRLAAGDW